MATRKIPLATEELYHLYNRGVDKRIVFSSNFEYQRFLNTLLYSQYPHLKRFSWNKFPLDKLGQEHKNDAIVQLLGFCLIPNHFHLVVRQLIDSGISKFMHGLGTSYTNFFNTKHERSGSLFQSTFQSVHIKTDEQLIHVIRYIHLNPAVSGLVEKPEDWFWSSHLDYLNLRKPPLIDTQEVLSYFSLTNDPGQKINAYKNFVDDHIAYAKEWKRMMRDLKDEATS